MPTFDVPYFKYIDEEDEEDEWSSRSQSSTEDDSVDSLLSDRYMVVSGTPEKILEHLLNDLHLDEVQDKETGTIQNTAVTALLLFQMPAAKEDMHATLWTAFLYYTRLTKDGVVIITNYYYVKHILRCHYNVTLFCDEQPSTEGCLVCKTITTNICVNCIPPHHLLPTPQEIKAAAEPL